MPLEIDDQSIRIIGNNFKGLKFYDDLRTLQQEIYLKADNTLNIGGGTGGGGGSGGMEAHAIDGVLHVGTLADVQGPQFLLLDGTRPMTAALDMGTFAINNVGLVDGVDVSGHGARHAAAGGDAVDHDALTNFVADEHIAHSGVTLTAGAGLTGGGTIAASRTFAVGAGDGIDVAADSVAVDVTDILGSGLTESSNNIDLDWGTPTIGTIEPDDAAAAGSSTNPARSDHQHAIACAAATTLTVASTNTEGAGSDFARALHTHAITSSSNPGAAASILASSAAGYLQLVRLGIGVSPSYPLHIQGTTEQCRVQYDAANYAAFTVSSGGILTIAPTGDLVLDPGGNDVLPGSSVADDLGDYNRMWRTLYAAELYVETLVAQDVLSTIGGRILVAPTTSLIADAAAAAATIDVKHNNLALNDYILLKAAPGGVAQIEVMQVTSGATGITGGYRYSVTRNKDGTGANDWVTGDAVANLGYAAGEGYIELTSTSTIHSDLGPNITIYTRNATTNWNDVDPTVAVGNLESFVDYSTYEVGFAVGNDLALTPSTGFQGLTADRTDGLRLFNVGLEMYDSANLRIQADPTATGTDAMLWAGLSPSDKRFVVTGDGDVWLSTLAVSESLGQSLFSAADGLLLLGPGCAITPTSWTSTRGQAATISGAFHRVAGRWPETKALIVEAGGTNEHIDPTAQGTGNWTAGGTTPPTLTEQSTEVAPYAGTYTAKCVWPSGGSTGYAGCHLNGRNITIANGKTYTFSLWMRATDIAELSKITAYVGGSATYGATALSNWVSQPHGWYRLSITFTNSSGGDQTERLILYVTAALSAATTTYIDGCQYEESTATTLIHGDAGTGYSWSGTAYASTSTRAATQINLDAYAGILSGKNALTLALWVQAPYNSTVGTWNTGYPALFDVYYDASNRIELLYNATSTGYFYVAVNGTTINDGYSALTFAAGDWLHIVATLDFSGDVYCVYVNGARTIYNTADTASAPTGLNQMNLGSTYAASSRWGGAIAEAAIFNSVLTAEEVAALYATGRPLADMGALKRPGIYILDGEFDIRSSQTGARVQIDVNGVAGYSAATTKTFSLETDGDLFLGSDISAVGTTALAVFANAQTYNSESMGAGDVLLGDNSAGKINLLWDVSEGDIILRRGNGAGAARITLDGSADSILIGQAAASQNNVLISSGAISIRNNTTERIGVTAAGILTIKDSAGNAVITLDASTGAEITKKLTLPGANSAIAIGSTPPTAHNAGTGIWIDRTGLFALDAGTYQVKVDATDGKLYAGAGNVFLDSDGVSVALGTGRPNGVCWVDGLYVRGKVWTYAPSAVDSYIHLGAFGEAGGSGYLSLTVSDNDFFQTETVTLSTSLLSSSVPLDVTGDVWCSGQISTDGGTTQWDLGAYSAGAPTADGYVSVVINGSTYKLLCDKV